VKIKSVIQVKDSEDLYTSDILIGFALLRLLLLTF